MNKPSSYGRFEPLFCCPAILCLLSILWLTDNTRGEEILQRCINNSLWAFFLKWVKLKEETTWTAFLKREEEGFMLNLRIFVLAEKGEKDLGVINNVCWVYKIQNKTKKKIVYQVLRQNLPLVPDGLTMVDYKHLQLQTIEESLLILFNSSTPHSLPC